MRKIPITCSIGMLRNTILILLLMMPSIPAGDIRIVSPYLGSITDCYINRDRNLDLEDHSWMKGLFFQWVSPNRYQWNTFIYQSSDINYSTIWGGHFILDSYWKPGHRGRWVAGIGAEYLRIRMDADSSLIPLKNFELTNHLYIPYLRFGYCYQFNRPHLIISILPWGGIEYQGTRGDLDLSIDPPGPAPLSTVSQDLSDDRWLGIAGLNLNLRLFHMVEVEGKYNGAFDADDYYSTVSAMLNLFFTRSWGVSYRFKSMELSKGSDRYHILGLAWVF
ncbi:MAG: hypothetical protein KBA26_12995 [Candidatus Delongbacteria bacterium]|nr:hypothetical protein [Candidatus Delongbacteria bacterium]